MKQDKERFEAYYTNDNYEEARGKHTKQDIIEFLTTKKYMTEVIPPQSAILDACAGTGYYSFFLAEREHTVTAGDFTAHNVGLIQAKQAENPVLHDMYQGSVTDLSRFANGSFDVVLNMGAYYHMTDAAERGKGIAECLRVLKRGGLFFLAYLNKYCNFVQYPERWAEDFSVAERLFTRGHRDDDSLFFYTTPEDVESDLTQHGVTILHNIAADGMKHGLADTVNNLDDETFGRFLRYHYATCEVRSILGYSEHGLVIGRKG